MSNHRIGCDCYPCRRRRADRNEKIAAFLVGSAVVAILWLLAR